MAFNDEVKTYLEDLKNGKTTLDRTIELITALKVASKDTSDGFRDLSNSFEGFSKLSVQNTNTLKGTITAFAQLKYAADNFKDSLQSMSALGQLVGLDDIFKAATAPISGITDIIKNIGEAAANTASALDGMDAGTRELKDSQFSLAANLGLGFDEATKFAEAYRNIISSNSELTKTGFYINADDFQKATSALQKQGIAMDELAEKTDVAGRSLNYVQTMTMQARAMGMDVENYARKMGDMVRKSGISMEDSMKLLASTQDIAKETGLKVDEVTQSLEGASNGFQRMGTTINFGMPVLKGFASSISEVGLGIAQAGDLAADFSKNLLNIVNNPALAYITSIKSGLSGAMGGGGGILNPSIQMQAMMLDQSPDSQAELARNLSIGMRETLKSFSGSDIISVKQAAESPELQTKLYAQQQMLGSQFGISDTATQNRVLEYLQKLEEATYAGDDEAASMLEKQISEAANANDKTMSIQEKISLAMDKSIIIAQDQLASQKGMLTGIMMGVKNESGTEGEDAFIKRFYTELDNTSKLFGMQKDLSGMSEEELKKYNEDYNSNIEKVANKYRKTQNETPSEDGAAPGTAKVGTASNQSVTITLINNSDTVVDVAAAGTAAAPRVIIGPASDKK